jgi:hypothetical protein
MRSTLPQSLHPTCGMGNTRRQEVSGAQDEEEQEKTARAPLLLILCPLVRTGVPPALWRNANVVFDLGNARRGRGNPFSFRSFHP